MSGLRWTLGGTLWFLITAACAGLFQRMAAWPLPVVIIVVFLSSRWSRPALLALAMWLGYIMGLQDGYAPGHQMLTAALMTATVILTMGHMIPQTMLSFGAMCMVATCFHEILFWLLRLPESTVTFIDLLPILGWRMVVTGISSALLFPVLMIVSPGTQFDTRLPRGHVIGSR